MQSRKEQELLRVGLCILWNFISMIILCSWWTISFHPFLIVFIIWVGVYNIFSDLNNFIYFFFSEVDQRCCKWNIVCSYLLDVGYSSNILQSGWCIRVYNICVTQLPCANLFLSRKCSIAILIERYYFLFGGDLCILCTSLAKLLRLKLIRNINFVHLENSVKPVENTPFSILICNVLNDDIITPCQNMEIRTPLTFNRHC